MTSLTEAMGSNMTTFKTGKEFFEQSSIEISKRKATVETTRKKGGRMTADEAPLRAKSKTRPIPLRDPLQNIVLLNIAHANQPTVSKNGLGAFRILGLFESPQYLTKHANTKLSDKQRTTKLEGHPTHAYKLIPRSPKEEGVELEQIQRLYKTHQDQAVVRKERFVEYCQERSTREVDEYEQLDLLSKEKKKRKDRTAHLEGSITPSDESEEVSDDTLPPIYGQRFAAVGIVFDNTDLLEHAICVYAAFESEEKCERYVEETLTDSVRDIPLFVVDMYHWVYPDVIRSSMANTIPTGYRHEELHNIMTAHDEERRMREKVKDKIEVTEYSPQEAPEFLKVN